eukprot:TRINITY_DN30072_c0_g1_i1.p1 TRINITY_DN30072_c0_g1~~TRINITY_DN30072_c0_g1_i1.p1  ORF type:complete len:115 (-),score=16.54 TRINITY_DN30072_c0_g1_i1:6-350(-)
MCQHCIVQPLEDRGSICLESGTYYVNYKGCVKCGGGMADLRVIEMATEEDEEEMSEEVTYKHQCKKCEHIICEHFYQFQVDKGEGVQDYLMECLLCGKGQYTQDIHIVPQVPLM